MISSRNIIFIYFLLTFLDRMMSVYGLTKCEKNIFTEFEFIEKLPDNERLDMPRRAFLRKTINDFINHDAMSYFEYLCLLLHHKENMLLPREFCDVRTKALKLRVNELRETEYQKCIILLNTTFLNSEDKIDLLKTTFWYFTEKMISIFDTNDYRYKYFYYLSEKLIYHNTADEKFPLTVKDYCAALYSGIKLKPFDVLTNSNSSKTESSKETTIQNCTTQIFNDFDMTSVAKQRRCRSLLPKVAFLNYVEDDLESPDAKDFYYHINCLIKAKDGTENPRQYCNTITKAENGFESPDAKDFYYHINGVIKAKDDYLKIIEEQKIQEEKKCVGYLLSMYLDSADATTVLKDTFRNFKESHFAKIDRFDYRFRYFYYLSGNYEFYSSETITNAVLTPFEFCQLDRTEALNPQLLME